VNQHDLDNIRFLLNRTPDQLREWYNSVSDEDLRYANEIMEQYAWYIEDQIQELTVESRLSQKLWTESQSVIAMIKGQL
jgi:hypothetical protein